MIATLMLAALTAFAPAPPGTVVQSHVVYLAGEAMHSRWRGVLSKKLVGTGATTQYFQWYLSIYQIDGATYRLRYQSPRDGGPFDTVEKASGAPMWFPSQSGAIDGAAELMEPGIQQLVVESHQVGADCGSALVSIFGYDATQHRVIPQATVENGCDLRAKIVTGTNSVPAMVELTGPYYKRDAPMCCPTKAHARATLHYLNGKWVVTPAFYTVYQRSFPHP